MSSEPSGTVGDQDELNSIEQPQGVGQKRRLTSTVWFHFTKFKDSDGEDKARCNRCEKLFVGGSNKGTSHLRNHLKRCKPDDAMQQPGSRKPSGGTPKTQVYKFDQENSRRDLAVMIIKHKYPFNICEHEFFENFCNGLNPNFKLVSRNTIRADILDVYQEEKAKLYNFLESLSSKITLTTDIWTSDHQNIAYTCLTAHFINDDWVLKKKILAYKRIDYPHDGETLFKFICELILEWNLDKKLVAMVVDNGTANDAMVKRLKTWLNSSSLLSLGGDLFHVRCSAHILNLIVHDGLSKIARLLTKIRETVKYLAKSPFAKQKFDLAVSQVKLRGKKKVPMDVQTRWNSTYSMLEASLSLKEAFVRLAHFDRNYKYNPTEEEWQVASVVNGCLGVFYDATNHFSGSHFPTSNVFFPDICHIRLQLMDRENSEHECLRVMAGPMKEKFEKYWEECSLVLAIAIVLDPRFKMDLVEYYYKKIYGDDADRYIHRVHSAFIDLYNEYGGGVSHSTDSLVHVMDDGSSSSLVSCSSENDKLSGFDRWYALSRASNIRAYQKSELEQYLEEPVFPRAEKFNILHWWKVNSAKLPILASVARDILAVPATTVASESAISIGGRVVDETRACLLPEIVDPLVTCDDWIESQRKINVEESNEA